MSFSAGVFTINTTGQPVVTGTVISAPVFNAFTADIATGLSTCILKDGTQTATASVPFVQGITVGSGTTISSTGAITACPSINFGQTTLSYYGEGTWTPSLGGNTTYGTQVGTYTRIGRLVYENASLGITTLGTGSTTTVTGSAFSAAASPTGPAGPVAFWNSLAVNVLHLGCYRNGTSTFFVAQTAAGTSSSNNVAIFNDGASIQWSVCYNV